MNPDRDRSDSNSRNPVRALDLFVALGGLGVLVGLGLEWNVDPGDSGYSSLTLLRIFLIIVALAGLALPIVLAMTRKSDLPVVLEALLAPVSSLLFVILAVKVILGPTGGAGTGMVLATVGALLLSACCWKALSRET